MTQKMLAVVMCLLLPSGPLRANTGVAIGNFSGDVSINGHPVTRNTAVFPGDKLMTGHNAAAYVSRPGFVMSLGGESWAELLGGGARMLNGSVQVTLKRGVVVEYADLRISAASDVATVEIVSRQGSEKIASLSGNLNVNDTSSSVTVPQGQALYAMAAMPEDPQSGGRQAPTPAATPGLRDFVLGAIVGGVVVGGILGGLAASGAFNSASISPSRP